MDLMMLGLVLAFMLVLIITSSKVISLEQMMLILLVLETGSDCTSLDQTILSVEQRLLVEIYFRVIMVMVFILATD